MAPHLLIGVRLVGLEVDLELGAGLVDLGVLGRHLRGMVLLDFRRLLLVAAITVVEVGLIMLVEVGTVMLAGVALVMLEVALAILLVALSWLVERALVVPEVAVLRLVEVTLVMLGLGRWDAKAVAALAVHLVLQRVPGLASNFHGVPLPWDL